jgi:fido (protein-threonine AMPylation protein)
MVNNLDVKDLMVTTFLGYKYRKQNDLLYSVNAKIPRSLISMYYSDDVERIDTTVINKRFVDRYIKNESAMENVHEQKEIEGLEVMYEHMINMPFEEFEMFSILTLHRDLYSKCPYPEAGGKFRTGDVYLPGTGTETCNYAYIFDKMLQFEDVVNNLKRMAIYMRETKDYSNIFEYINACVRLNCDLIKVHPFQDGNGRTIRCFTNKLFEEAGIPPVYIRLNERQDYARGMNLANNEGDYSEINAFYLYKICDSIIELDINKRVREERSVETYDIKKKSKKKKNKKK